MELLICNSNNTNTLIFAVSILFCLSLFVLIMKGHEKDNKKNYKSTFKRYFK